MNDHRVIDLEAAVLHHNTDTKRLVVRFQIASPYWVDEHEAANGNWSLALPYFEMMCLLFTFQQSQFFRLKIKDSQRILRDVQNMLAQQAAAGIHAEQPMTATEYQRRNDEVRQPSFDPMQIHTGEEMPEIKPGIVPGGGESGGGGTSGSWSEPEPESSSEVESGNDDNGSTGGTQDP